MFAISEVTPGSGAYASQSASQQQVIASVIAQQRVIAAQSGAQSGDAAGRQFSGQSFRERAGQFSSRMDSREHERSERTRQSQRQDGSASARSIVEAQEASLQSRTITAAFQARYGMTELLQVIRDPQDVVLPRSPDVTNPPK